LGHRREETRDAVENRMSEGRGVRGLVDRDLPAAIKELKRNGKATGRETAVAGFARSETCAERGSRLFEKSRASGPALRSLVLLPHFGGIASESGERWAIPRAVEFGSFNGKPGTSGGDCVAAGRQRSRLRLAVNEGQFEPRAV